MYVISLFGRWIICFYSLQTNEPEEDTQIADGTSNRASSLHFIFISRCTVGTALQFAGYPYTKGTQKAAKISNKNSSFNWVHSLHTGSMNASHSTNLFKNSCHSYFHQRQSSSKFPFKPTTPHNSSIHCQLDARIFSVFLSQVEHEICSQNLLTLKRKI